MFSTERMNADGLRRQRRPQRSCDLCRQRKTRCDGPTMPDGCCTNCLTFGASCTYLQPAKKRGPKNTLVEELQKENASLKAKLRSLSLCSLCAQPLQSGSRLLDSPSRNASIFHQSTPESDSSTSTDAQEPKAEPDITGDELAARFGQFSLDSMRNKYFGAASSFALAGNVVCNAKTSKRRQSYSRRPWFWDILPWEEETYAHRPHYVYPPTDLISSLVHLYFTNLHPTIAILHRPSFEQSVAEGLYLTNTEFGGALLAVMALASRYSNDPRVFVEGDSSLSAGWPFARQISVLRKLIEPSIYELQMYALLAFYNLGSSTPQVTWVYVGVGIRLLQQRGEHRRKPEGHRPNHEDELWKRAFWSFVLLERMVCVFLGRPMGLHVEGYDVGFPLEVDDEYWDQGFTQPLGKPSQVSFMVTQLRLGEIMGDAMRRLYSSKKAKLLLGWDGPDWEARVVAELDSAMNSLRDSMPPHLRWNPDTPPQGTFFDQSAIFNINYNYTLITIHRPYIYKATVLAAPSLSMCASAARAIIHTAEIWITKLQRLPLPTLLNPVFLSGIILVINVLGARRAGVSGDQSKDLALVEKAMDILKFAESRLQPVGRLWELLREVRSLDSPLHSPNKEPNSHGGGTDKVVSEPSLSNVPVDFFPQHGQALHSDQTSHGPQTGTSIEQMLADTGAMDVSFDEELLSMWMAAPTDVLNVGHWDAYIENRDMHGLHMSRPNGFVPQQPPHY
ncbi:fungal-specific transcription factor domain-containing protein [Mycena polygramma]|nr:fungal-specific transcription factor domain-containing protein [Mycena polygramma]